MKKANPFLLSIILKQIQRRLARIFQKLFLTGLYIRYRFFRRILYRYQLLTSHAVTLRYRLLRKIRFRFIRLLVFFMWRLWVREVVGLENIPEREAALIVSNHTSYYDFFVLASVLKKQTVFVAVKGLKQRTFVGWFMKLDTIIYIDRDKPGFTFFKELMRQIQERKTIAIYPEGTRSRSGKMLSPKLGFVKLAIKGNVPIIPVAMVGTYDILPPHKNVPAFRKCSVVVGRKLYISPSTPLFKDIFFRRKDRKRFEDLTDDELEEIAFRVMDEVRKLSYQEWDESALEKAELFGLAKRSAVGTGHEYKTSRVL